MGGRTSACGEGPVLRRTLGRTDGRTCDQLPHFCVGRLPQQSEEGRDPACIPHSDLVVIRGFPIDQVPQGPASISLHLQSFVVQKIHQVLNPAQPADLQQNSRKDTLGKEPIHKKENLSLTSS